MQDRFKLRVWDKRTKELKNILGFCRSNGFEELINIQYANGSYVGCIPFEDVEIMQCTGLKDKNGKLIFEGDILKYEFEKLGIALNSRYVIKQGVIRVPPDCFVAQCFDYINHCTAICQCDWIKSEVIGNIYENNEFLKEVENGR